MKTIFAVFEFLFLIGVQAGAQSSLPPIDTVNSVDLQRYLGTWYEIAAIPQSFEKKCIGNTKAEYANAENGLISVVNSCDTASGRRSVANGRAKVVDKISNAKLKVTFVNFLGWQFLLGGKYWILDLGENYSYAVVGSPDRNYAWILSRAPKMTEEQISAASHALMKQDFDTCKLISTIQASGLQEKSPLCQLVPGN